MEILNELVAKHGYDAVQSALKEVGKTLPQMKVALTDLCSLSLSAKAQEWLWDRGVTCKFEWDIDRHNPLLIECLETLGSESSFHYAHIEIVEVPEGVTYHISTADDYETISW